MKSLLKVASVFGFVCMLFACSSDSPKPSTAEPETELVREYFPDSSIAAEGHVIAGTDRLHGQFTRYHENGIKKVEAIYRSGSANGWWREWHENGQMRIVGLVKDDKEEGYWVGWYPNGIKKMEGHYVAGKNQGIWTYWDSLGNLAARDEFERGVRIPYFEYVEADDLSHGGASRIQVVIRTAQNDNKDELRQLFRKVTDHYKSQYDIVWVVLIPRKASEEERRWLDLGGWEENVYPRIAMSMYVAPSAEEWRPGFLALDEVWENIAISWRSPGIYIYDGGQSP